MTQNSPPPAIERARSCKSCRYFVLIEPQHTHGDCHRQPPQFNFNAYFTEDGYYTPKRYKTEISRQRDGVWPNVRDDEWCGEFLPNPRVQP